MQSRPVTFVYSALGAQWITMGKELMEISAFKNSIEKSSAVLKPHGLNLEELIFNADAAFKNLINSFVSMTAVQIALTDVLTSFGIKPDVTVGHCLGEFGCAYIDGALSAEQTIMAAYARARAIAESEFAPGTMAVVGLTAEEVTQRSPAEVAVVCHNSSHSVTISGPKETVEKFVEQLKTENVSVRVINSFCIAFHTKHVVDAAPKVLQALNEVIPTPKSRSPKWISSSVPESEWETPLGQKASAVYFTNAMIAPILFAEAIKHIPEDAVVIEITPSGFLQAILKKELGPQNVIVSLMDRQQANMAEFLLSAIEKITSVQLNVEKGSCTGELVADRTMTTGLECF